MLTGIGEYRGDRAIGYARVHVICEPDGAPVRIKIALDDHEWNDQLRDGSFGGWTDAAIAGCHFALQAINKDTGNWTVHRIVGLLVDTTVEYVTIASARATWAAARYDASDHDKSALRDFAQKTVPPEQEHN